MGGVGIPRLSDRAQVMKWEAMLRCMAVGRVSLNSVNTILRRVPGPKHPPRTPIKTIRPPNQWSAPYGHIMARSLVSWAHRSGLQLASRVYESPEEERAQIRNQTSIQEVAELLHLWPSELYHEDDDLREVRLFATDGSFTIQPTSIRDILTPEAQLRDQGKGAGGIVLIPPEHSREATEAIRIISTMPEPGMNAFTWELLSQLVALTLMKHLPNIDGYSDCTSALARTVQALNSTHDNLAHTRAGIWASGIHAIADRTQHRQFHHIKAHPERDKERSANPTILDKAIFMAYSAAGNTNRRLGGREMHMIRHELKLENILNELVPLNRWHFRLLDRDQTPVLDDLITHQHRAQLTKMLTNRDQYNTENKWTSTAIPFANKVHPVKNTSFWAAARRSLILYDWLGHGRNLAKMKPPGSLAHQTAAACPHCTQPDGQAHCMLECTSPKFNTIRRRARVSQSAIAAKLLSKHECPHLKYFIQMHFHASWESSPQTSRLWLGTWQMDTLASLINQPIDNPLSNDQRYTYIKIARDMTKPLLQAYNEMIHINTTHNPRYRTKRHEEEEPLPWLEHQAVTEHAQHHAQCAELGVTWEQNPLITTPSLNNTCTLTHTTNAYIISDTAFQVEEADEMF